MVKLLAWWLIAMAVVIVFLMGADEQ